MRWLLALWLALSPALADGVSAPIAAAPIGKSDAAISFPPQIGGGSSYTGPGDILSGALAWWGIGRCYSAAYASSNGKAYLLLRSSDSTTRQINCLSTGYTDSATATTFCNATTCTITAIYDQSGQTKCNTGASPCDLGLRSSTGSPLALAAVGSCAAANFTSALGYITATAIATTAQPVSWAVIAERTGAFTTAQYIQADSGGGAGFGYAASANTLTAVYGSTQTITASDSAFHAIQVTANGASGAYYIDGANTTENFGAVGISGQIYVGTYNSGASPLTNGIIEEIGVWPTSFVTAGVQASLNSNMHSATVGCNF